MVEGERMNGRRPDGGRPFVSVVTPVHNGARFLDECIDSVRAQTYDHWEHVIVDNVSTDETREIAAARAAEDPRIRVVACDEFVGSVASFNRAFGFMSGEAVYCKPLAADDLLFPTCLERMVAVAAARPEVGLVSAYRIQGTTIDFTGVPLDVEVAAGRDVCRGALLGGLWVFGAATSTMIRADLVRRRVPFYNEANLHADLEACFEILGDSEFAFVHQLLTYTRRHEGSVTRRATLRTHRAETLRMHRRFAPLYLPDDEDERRTAVLLARYLSDLAAHPLGFRSREARSYHLGVLRDVYASLPARRLARGYLAQARRLVAGPRGNGADWFAARTAASSLR